jgi:hypothetical protein
LKRASLLNLVRCPRFIFLAFLATIGAPGSGSGSSLPAADYSVDVGVDTRAGKDAGTLECVLDELCTMRLDPFGLAIYVRVSSRDRDRANVRLFENEPGCCYFNGGASSALVNLRDTLSRLPIFLRDRTRGACSSRTSGPLERFILDFSDADAFRSRERSTRKAGFCSC